MTIEVIDQLEVLNAGDIVGIVPAVDDATQISSQQLVDTLGDIHSSYQTRLRIGEIDKSIDTVIDGTALSFLSGDTVAYDEDPEPTLFRIESLLDQKTKLNMQRILRTAYINAKIIFLSRTLNHPSGDAIIRASSDGWNAIQRRINPNVTSPEYEATGTLGQVTEKGVLILRSGRSIFEVNPFVKSSLGIEHTLDIDVQYPHPLATQT
ncbi:MAG TPA: hypothetical protein VIH90_07035 [Candidatus Saccharimonadales bacterium]